MKKDDQIFRTRFLAKYVGLPIYDIDTEKKYSIYDKEIHSVKGVGYALIGNPDHPDGTSTDHEYFCIHDDLSVCWTGLHVPIAYSLLGGGIPSYSYDLKIFSLHTR